MPDDPDFDAQADEIFGMLRSAFEAVDPNFAAFIEEKATRHGTTPNQEIALICLDALERSDHPSGNALTRLFAKTEPLDLGPMGKMGVELGIEGFTSDGDVIPDPRSN